MNGVVVGAAHINRLAQGMVNELLAANGGGGNGLGLGVDLLGNGGGLNGGGVVLSNSNMTSSRSSTSPSIGKLIENLLAHFLMILKKLRHFIVHGR